MKRNILTILLVSAVILSSVGCGDNSSKTENNTVVDSVRSVPKDTSQASSTSTAMINEFATNAAIGNMMEVEIGKIAQSNGGSAEVKEYGKMLQTDHSAANTKLQSVAEAEHITLPTAMDAEHSAHAKEMGAMKGVDFDKAFIPMMIEDHNKDIAEFKKAADSNPNQKIKDFASMTLPTLQKHLDKANSIKSKMK